MERRLAAILAADVVGYSRLIREDEAGTLAALKAHREQLIAPKIAERKGRIVKLMGDGLLVEFPSAVEAVQCAVEIQHLIGERNADVPEEKQIVYRIGINIGDIVVEDDDIYGDGVNVAARLEGLAEPSGICVARNVFNQVKDKLDLTIEHLGEREVKNIAEPVTVYRVVLDDKAAALVTPVIREATKPVSRRWVVAAAAAAVLVAAVGGVSWWQPWAPDVEPASLERMAFPLPDKPSIAVLAFDNLSGDPEQDYFADGITEDLITDLSKISGLFVIARNSSFSYKGQQVKVQQVAEELGVRYVLEGSVRRAGNTVRINAQLIDATTGGHVWAERYDGTLADVFALQDQVTRRIVTALAVTLTSDEARQAATAETDNVAAYDAFLQGWARYNRQTPKDFAQAIPLFEKAIELDPNYGRAYGALALTYHIGSERGLSGPLKVPWYVLRIRARKYLDLALENPTAPAHVVAALMALKQRLFGDAVAHMERAVALDPNDAEAHSMMAYVLVYDDRPEDAIKHAQQALRLDPNNPSRPLQWIGRAHFAQGNLEESLSWLERAREHNPSVFPAALVVASARAHLGQTQEARTALEVYTDTWGSPPPLKKIMYWWSFKKSVVAKRFTAGILKAGLPDESGVYYQVSENDRLSGTQIADLLLGRTISGDGPWDGKLWRRSYGDDGSVAWRGPPVDEVPWHGPSVETDQGVSMVKGDLLCEAWSVMNEGYETCFPVFRNPNGTVKAQDEYLFITDTGIYPWSLFE
jgi:TolB-like protein/class 3 adenylate cyclase